MTSGGGVFTSWRNGDAAGEQTDSRTRVQAAVFAFRSGFARPEGG